MLADDQLSRSHKTSGAGETSAELPVAPETFVDAPLWRQDPPHQGKPGLADLPPRTWYLSFKVVLEFVIALVLLVFSLPVILVTALLVKLTSPGPAFYCQQRVGRHGRRFWLYKLRTMANDCEKTSGPRWAVPGDKRVTPLGRFLRRTHLDELPQLWNVLKGEMSLVGPRPERPEFVPELELAIPHYLDRLLVRPGVTGLAQVQLPADTDLASVRRKLAYDLYYIRYINIWLDLRLIGCTAVRMLGIPFHVLGQLFGLPHVGQVEHHYRARQSAAAAPLGFDGSICPTPLAKSYTGRSRDPARRL
jgi:lipopolysaccharide/colanic/teichoic acid biosynthesis glycosyltransferase